jgi:hypothetical protein
MERIVRAQSSEKENPMLNFYLGQKKVLELNPRNALIKEILGKVENIMESGNGGDLELKFYFRTLVDSMTISSGFSIKNTNTFAKRMDRIMKKAMGMPVEELEVEKKEVEPVVKKDESAEDSYDIAAESAKINKDGKDSQEKSMEEASMEKDEL